MTIKRHWTDTIAMGIVFEQHRSKALDETHAERFRRVAVDESDGSRIESLHSLSVLDSERVQEDTLQLDEAKGEMVVVDTQVFEGREAIEGRFGRDKDVLYSQQPEVAYGESPFYLSYEPTLPSQAKR